MTQVMNAKKLHSFHTPCPIRKIPGVFTVFPRTGSLNSYSWKPSGLSEKTERNDGTGLVTCSVEKLSDEQHNPRIYSEF